MNDPTKKMEKKKMKQIQVTAHGDGTMCLDLSACDFEPASLKALFRVGTECETPCQMSVFDGGMRFRFEAERIVNVWFMGSDLSLDVTAPRGVDVAPFVKFATSIVNEFESEFAHDIKLCSETEVPNE